MRERAGTKTRDGDKGRILPHQSRRSREIAPCQLPPLGEAQKPLGGSTVLAQHYSVKNGAFLPCNPGEGPV